MPDELVLYNEPHFASLETILANDIKTNFLNLINRANLTTQEIEGLRSLGNKYLGEFSTTAIVASSSTLPAVVPDGVVVGVSIRGTLPATENITLKVNALSALPVMGEGGIQLKGKDIPIKTMLLLVKRGSSWVSVAGHPLKTDRFSAPMPSNHASNANRMLMTGRLEVPALSGGVIYKNTGVTTIDLSVGDVLNGRDYTTSVTTTSTHTLYAIAQEDGSTPGFVLSKNRDATSFYLRLTDSPTSEKAVFPLVYKFPFAFLPLEDGTIPRFHMIEWERDYAEFGYLGIARGNDIREIPDPPGGDTATPASDKLIIRDQGATAYTDASTFNWVPTVAQWITVHAICEGAGEMTLYHADELSSDVGNVLTSIIDYYPEHTMRVKISMDPPRLYYKVASGSWRVQVGSYQIHL